MRYLRIWKCCLTIALVREMQFRLNFLMWGLAMLAEFSVLLLLHGSLFGLTDTIAGWNRWQWSLYLGLGQVMLTLFMVFVFPNLVGLPWQVNSGGLDFHLLRPADSQFMVSLARANLGYLVNLPLGILLLGYGMGGASFPGLLAVIPGLVWTLSGLLLLYAIFMVAVTVSVWSKRAGFASELFFGLWQYMRQPPDVFGRGAGFVFTWLVPVLAVVAAPARLFLGKGGIVTAFPALALAVLWFCAARLLWKRALKSYTGCGC